MNEQQPKEREPISDEAIGILADCTAMEVTPETAPRLAREIRELRKDKERLDWLWNNGRLDIFDDDGMLTPREAIDAEMKEEAKS